MIPTVHLFPEERAALLSLLESLTPGHWEITDVYPGWSLKDVVSHLLADDLGRLSRGRDGYAAALFTFTTAETFEADLLAWINRQNNLWVEATRGLSPRILIDLLRWSGEHTQAYWESLDMDALTEPVSWAGPERAPVWLDVARELTERWLHQQHIREAAGASPMYDERIFVPVLDTFAHAIPHTYRDVDAPEGTRVRMALLLPGAGPAGRPALRYDVARAFGRWRLVAPSGGEPVAQATMPADMAWRLFTKSVTPDEARVSAILEGDPALATKMLETVSIIA